MCHHVAKVVSTLEWFPRHPGSQEHQGYSLRLATGSSPTVTYARPRHINLIIPKNLCQVEIKISKKISANAKLADINFLY
jgi:hypothetical protein